VRLPGLNLGGILRARASPGGQLRLVTDGFDTDLARAFQGGEGFVLSKPIDEAEVHRICRTVEERGVFRPFFRAAMPFPSATVRESVIFHIRCYNCPMRFTSLAVLLGAAFICSAQQPNVAAQREAMKKLEFLAGNGR